MTIYNSKNDYIQFLRTFDTKIEENKNEKRPYVGIVLQIGSIEYYAPLTSPKPKHKNMKNSKDFRKIENGKYGAINFFDVLPRASPWESGHGNDGCTPKGVLHRLWPARPVRPRLIV